MKILVFGPRDRYDVYRPPFADEMPVELVLPSAPLQPVTATVPFSPFSGAVRTVQVREKVSELGLLLYCFQQSSTLNVPPTDDTE